MGSRARRGQAVAGSADLTSVDLDDGEPCLVAGLCVECGTHVFPLRVRCPSCGGDIERELLPARGTLWTWTTQGFEPKPPYVADGDGEFVPYGVGYVEFAGYLRVEGRLTERDPERLQIGMTMRVVAVSRGDRVTYAFAPE
jgi:uncharacterized OB-fold protein